MSGKNLIFLDGEIIDANKDLLMSLTPGVVQGKGMFETMLVSDEEILFLEEHWLRMQRGLRLLKIKEPYSFQKICRNLYDVLKMNKLKNARIRLSIWQEGLDQHIAIVAQPIKGVLLKQNQKGYHVTISSILRPKKRTSYVKSLDYSIFREALSSAKEKGYDEAILLNHRGELVEGATSNLFWVKKGVLYTPAVECGCLNGVTRQIILKLARKINIPIQIIQAKVESLLTSDEAFLTNSLRGIIRLKNVDRKNIGDFKEFFVTKQLMEAYDDVLNNINSPVAR